MQEPVCIMVNKDRSFGLSVFFRKRTPLGKKTESHFSAMRIDRVRCSFTLQGYLTYENATP